MYDGNALVAEYGSANQLLRRYVHGAGSDVPLISFEGATTDYSVRRFLFADERGSVIATTNPAGTDVAINTYDDYGIPGNTNAGRFQYTGQAWIPELGLYYYKARMYSPTLGRFMQTDPIGYADGLNLYAYVGNDPVNATDPSGLATAFRAGESEPPSKVPDIVVTGGRLGFFPSFNGSGIATQPGLSGIQGFVEGPITVVGRKPNRSRQGSRPQSGHDYRTSNRVCARTLTNGEKSDLLSRFCAPTPTAGVSIRANALNLVTVGGVISGGFVRSTFSADGLSVTNVTTPVHAFVGVIERGFSDAGGTTSISTHGYGNAGGGFLGSIRDGLNNFFGPGLFNSLDSRAAGYAAANYKGC